VAESSWPTVAGGRSITDVQWEEMAGGFAASGIVAATSDTPVVYGDSTGMQVKVRANKLGNVSGNGWTSGPTEFTKAIGANATGSTRIDLVVLRLTRSSRAVTVEVRAGTPGAGVPSPVQDSIIAGTGIWEMPLAQVTVVSGASTISSTDVVNIAPYVGSPQILYVASVPALNLILNPVPGQVAYVAAAATTYPLYQYVTGTGWRRLDWNNSWGIVGGQRWSGSGVLAYYAGTNTDTGLRTGNVSLLNGRRYVIDVSLPQAYSASGTDVMLYTYLQLQKVGGSAFAEAPIPVVNVYQAWLFQQTFDYQPSVDETVNFQLNALVAKVAGGTLYWAGISRSDNQTYFRVWDAGPASLLTVG
jgi:hypothetical protein